MKNENVERVDPAYSPNYTLVSSFQGAPVYNYRQTEGNSSEPTSEPPRRRTEAELRTRDSITGVSHASSSIPPATAPPAPPAPIITVPVIKSRSEEIIPCPRGHFPNIKEGRMALGYTPTQWNYLYGRAQEVVMPFMEKNPQTPSTPLHMRPENHPENVGPIIAEFPDLKRCESNWGVKWVLKKARHAVTVRGVTDRRSSSSISLRDMAAEGLVEIKKEAGENCSEDNSQASAEGSQKSTSVGSVRSLRNEGSKTLPTPEKSHERPPVVPKVEVPEWHKYMAPKYTQGRGPSIYGLTRPIVPFFEPAAGPPSMRHATADLDSDKGTKIKKRIKRLPRPDVSSARSMDSTVIVNPEHGQDQSVDTNPTKNLRAFASFQPSSSSATSGVNTPKEVVSAPILFACENSGSHGPFGGDDPMQWSESEGSQSSLHSTPYSSISDFRKRKIADLQSIVHQYSQYNGPFNGRFVSPPPIVGEGQRPSFESVQRQTSKTPPHKVVEVRGAQRSVQMTGYPRPIALAGVSGGGVTSVIKEDSKPRAQALNYGSYGRVIRDNDLKQWQNTQFSGQTGPNRSQIGHPQVAGIYPNNIPYTDARNYVTTNNGGANPNVGTTPNGGKLQTILNHDGETPTTPTLPNPRSTGTLPSLTLPGINTLPGAGQNSPFGRGPIHYRYVSHIWDGYGNMSGPNVLGNEGTGTLQDRALPRPGGGEPRGGGTGSRNYGSPHGNSGVPENPDQDNA